jgi:sugar (pentulose or hexulose) kinase
MTTGPYLVGVDCGTQSAKVVIYDALGNAVAHGRRALRPMSRPSHGVVVHPEDDVWDAIAEASRLAVAGFAGVIGEIVGVGICPIRCCKAFLKADGTLAEPVISWMDDRAYRPYVPTDPQVRYATTLSGYVAHRFTGECKDTVANNIAMQWPIDAGTWQWSDDPAVFSEFGVTREKLFELQMPGEIIGNITLEAAAATGLPVGIPVVATANDKAVEMLGAGPLGETTALVSLGTYIAAMVYGREHRATPTNFWTNFACVPNRYLYESDGVRRGMWTLTWFLDLLGPEVAAAAGSLGISREEYLEREAALVPAGSDGLLTVLDWLAPTDKPFRKGMMLGFDARHTRGHIYRSILEAIALTMKFHVDAMCGEMELILTDLVISGGGATSALFTQIFADVFGLPTARRVGGGGASLGSAMCAAAAVGLYPDIPTASAAMARATETFQPDLASHVSYQQMGDTVYHSIRGYTDPLFKRSYPLFHAP